jgi:tetratricopeptide (TPR) repeat protein
MGTVADQIRAQLGDTAAQTSQNTETFTAASLEAVREYTIAQDLSLNQKDDEAIAHYQKATGYDDKFGRAYAGWAASALALGRRSEAEQRWKQALSLSDRMTEREKLRTSGGYYLGIARDYNQAITTYKTLVDKYPADFAGHNNLALAYFYVLDFPKALEEGRRAIEIYPRSSKFRGNYALYAMYAGDFAKAAATASELVKDDPKFDTAYLPLAMNALASGRPDEARGIYQKADAIGPAGKSLAALGLADLAMSQGRYDDAIGILDAQIPRETAAGSTVGAAAMLVAAAESQAALGRRDLAHANAAKALDLGRDDAIVVPVARVFQAIGRTAEVQKIITELGSRLQPQSRAYGKVITAEAALARGEFVQAIDALTEAKKFADLWLVSYVRGVAYLQSGKNAAAALQEFEACATTRRGEATAVFLDDLPTYRYLAPLPYWLGRSQEDLSQTKAAATSYQTFLKARASGKDDALVADARRRADALASR